MGITHQRGYISPRGKQWYGYYRKVVNDPTADEQKTVRAPIILGLKSQMSKFEAREALQREITKQLGQPGSKANRASVENCMSRLKVYGLAWCSRCLVEGHSI